MTNPRMERVCSGLVPGSFLRGCFVPSSRGVPVVFTLPDFWYQCVRGQRIDWRGDRCDTIDLSKCARCLRRKQ